MIVPGSGDVVSLLCDEGVYVCGSVQDLPPKEVLWLVCMEGCPGDTFFCNFVSKRQNRKFESGSPRKSRCFGTSVVEPNNLSRIETFETNLLNK